MTASAAQQPDSELADHVGDEPPRARPTLEVAVDLAQATHANFQDMVKVADAKATTLAGIQSVVMGVVLSSSAHGVSWLTGFFAVISTASIFCGLMVLVPRFPKFGQRPNLSRGLLWVADVSPFSGEPDKYLRELAATTQEQLLADYAFENLKLAALLQLKFGWLRRSVFILLFAVPLFLLLVFSTL